jgi:hypothetical protein
VFYDIVVLADSIIHMVLEFYIKLAAQTAPDFLKMLKIKHAGHTASFHTAD